MKNRIEKGSFFLYLCSIFFKTIVSFKNFLYDKKILKGKKIFSPVISVGNIIAGGSGKTPFIIFLAKKIQAKIGIVSRGYRSLAENKNICISSKQAKKMSFEEIGDEPLMIAKNVDVMFLLGKNKKKSFKKAGDVDILLMDDGFQKRSLYRDIDIVIISCADPFSNGYFLPKGFLRDSLKSLRRADYIVLSNADKEKFEKIKKEVQKYSKAPIFATAPFVCGIYDRNYKKVDIIIKKIGAFCSIAYPKLFFDLLKKEGYELVYTKEFLDHEDFSFEDLKEFLKKDIEAIFCTEKDIVKIKNIFLDIPIFFVKIDLKVLFGEKNWKNLMSTISKKIYNG